MKSKILNAIQEGIKLSFMIGSELEDEGYVKSKISKTEDFVPYDIRMVDLGLSVLWAEYNLGAYPGNSPESWYGDCYAWGETEPKINYILDAYKFKKSLTKYNESDNLKLLLPEDDAVTYKLGSMFRMPTLKEIAELCDNRNVANKWVKNYKRIYGLNGRVFTSKVPGFEGNSIFIPAAGYFDGSERSFASSNGGVWSSSLYSIIPIGAYYLNFYFDDIDPNGIDCRYSGLSIRSVQDKK